MDVPRPILLEGAHVRLEPLRAGHLDDLAAVYDPDCYAHMPGSPGAVGGWGAWLERATTAERLGREVPFAVVGRPDGRAVGTTRYLDLSPADERLEIGHTWLAAAARRTPVNTEAKRLLLGHAFDGLGAGRVALKTGAANVASMGAIERLGATPEGVLRRHVRLDDGRFRDTAWYAILASAWPAVRERLDARLAAG